MCGRYTLRTPIDVAAEEFRARYRQSILAFEPRFNIAPTQTLPILRNDEDAKLELTPMRWGLIPSWAKDAKIGASAINARAETISTKPMFRTAFQRRRCLVPVDGFYEWRGPRPGEEHHGTKKAVKIPHFIHMKTDELFTFAGLWESWRGPDGFVESYTILTTSPNELMAELHDRMPVIIPRDARAEWLAANTPLPRLHQLCVPYDASQMDAYVVSRNVNSPKNESPDLITPEAAA